MKSRNSERKYVGYKNHSRYWVTKRHSARSLIHQLQQFLDEYNVEDAEVEFDWDSREINYAQIKIFAVNNDATFVTIDPQTSRIHFTLELIDTRG